jgi:hypothetical protein
MPKRLGLLCFLAFTALFLLLNRAAYKGYFQDDEFDTISWMPYVHAAHYLEAAVSPRFQPDNFRPVGHFYYYIGQRLFDLDFPKWVALLHVLHLLNVWLLWLVLRRLGAPPLAAAAACLFWGLHMALFDAFWKPMYAFDVLCGTFCLLSILSYLDRRWVLSFVSFWLAYKAKEIAVMLPLVLAAAELWFGKGDWKRRWLPLAPFFLASLSFGLQGILLNPNHDNAYTFRFTPAALAQCSVFYASRVFLVPYLGFALPFAALVWRSRRAWFGLTAMVMLFFPLLFLPGRLLSPYCYVPFIGLAILFTSLAEASRPVGLAVFLLIWGMQDVREFRLQKPATLSVDGAVRQWAGAVAKFARGTPHPDAVIYSGEIPGFAYWGETGAIHYIYRDGNLPVAFTDDPRAASLLQLPRVVLINWNNVTRRVSVRLKSAETQAAYIRMDGSEPMEQLSDGWYGLEENYRWMAPRSLAQLMRPAGANRFELYGLASDAELTAAGPVTVQIAIDGHDLAPRTFAASEWQTVSWDVPPGPAGPVRVVITATPGFQPTGDARRLGLAVREFGFTASRP